MEVVILGSGSAFPSRGADGKVRNPAGVAVALDSRLVLFDLGFGNLRQLARAGLDPAAVSDVFLTHRHPDHCGDLAALLFLLRYDVKPKTGRLRVWGPRGLAKFVAGLQKAWAPWLSPKGYKLEVGEVSPKTPVEGRGFSVCALQVPHPTPALAYRLSYKGKSFVYSGDTGFAKDLPDFAAEADLFLLECTLSLREPADGHLNAPLALATLGAARCKKGVLVHLSDKSERELSAIVPKRSNVKIAKDLMRIAVA